MRRPLILELSYRILLTFQSCSICANGYFPIFHEFIEVMLMFRFLLFAMANTAKSRHLFNTSPEVSKTVLADDVEHL